MTDYPPGTWSGLNDGIVSGRILQATHACDVCGVPGCVVRVATYSGIDAEWRSTIIWAPHFVASRQELAVFLGISCGCLQKLHRQVAHIRDKRVLRHSAVSAQGSGTGESLRDVRTHRGRQDDA